HKCTHTHTHTRTHTHTHKLNPFAQTHFHFVFVFVLSVMCFVLHVFTRIYVCARVCVCVCARVCGGVHKCEQTGISSTPSDTRQKENRSRAQISCQNKRIICRLARCHNKEEASLSPDLLLGDRP